MFNVRFKEWDCVALVTHYPSNKQPCIVLVDANDGSVVAKATTCLTQFDWDEWSKKAGGGDFTAIKDYSENEGMLDALIDAGICIETGLALNNGNVMFPIVKLKPLPLLN